MQTALARQRLTPEVAHLQVQIDVRGAIGHICAGHPEQSASLVHSWGREHSELSAEIVLAAW